MQLKNSKSSIAANVSKTKLAATNQALHMSQISQQQLQLQLLQQQQQHQQQHQQQRCSSVGSTGSSTCDTFSSHSGSALSPTFPSGNNFISKMLAATTASPSPSATPHATPLATDNSATALAATLSGISNEKLSPNVVVAAAPATATSLLPASLSLRGMASRMPINAPPTDLLLPATTGCMPLLPSSVLPPPPPTPTAPTTAASAAAVSGGGGGGMGARAAAAAMAAANLAESFTLLQQQAANHFQDILYAAHLLGRGYYQPAGPLISPHVLPPVATGPPPPSLANVSLLPASTASKKQIPTPLGSDPEHLHAAPPSTNSAADSTDSDVLITGGDLTPFRYPQSSSAVAAAAAAANAAHQQQHQLHPQAHPGSPYQRSMHAAQMHYLTAYPPNYYTPYPGEAMCYSPPAAAYQTYFPTKVYQSGPPHPPPGAYRRYSYYPPSHPPPPAELYEQGPPPPQQPPPPPQTAPPTQHPGGNSSPHSVSSATSGASMQQQQQPPPPQGPTGSQLVPAGPAAHAQHLEHYPGPPGYYTGYSPGGAPPGQCYTRSLQTPYMEYPPQCPCPMQQSCPKNVNTGPHIGSNNSGSSISSTASGNSNNKLIAMTHNSSSSSNNCLNSSNNNSIVNGNQNSCNNNSSSSENTNISNTLTNAESSNHSSNNLKNSLNTGRGPVKNNNNNNTNSSVLISQQQEQQMEAAAKAYTTMTTSVTNLYQQQQQQQEQQHHQMLNGTSVKSELKTEDTDCKSQYEDHVVQPPTPPESYGTNDEKSLLIEDEVIDAAMERLEMSRLAAETATTILPAVAATTKAATSPATAIMPTAVEAYDLTASPSIEATTPTATKTTTTLQHSVNGTSNGHINRNGSSNASNGNSNQQSSLVVGRKARIGKTMAREMVYAAAATTPAAMFSTHSQQQPPQHPLIQVRTLPQQNAVNNNSTTVAATTAPLAVSNLVPESLSETLPLIASIKTEIKAEHIKLEDETAFEVILQQQQQQQQHISSNIYHHQQTNELKIKTEPLPANDSNQNVANHDEHDDDLIARLRQREQEDSNQTCKTPTHANKAAESIESGSSSSSSNNAITMPRPICEGRMRLLSSWQQQQQQKPKFNCEIDLSTTSDDDVLDLCQSPTGTAATTTDNTKRIKILDFQNGSAATQGKKSSPSGYKNLIKQAEPKAYLCLSRRRIEKRNRYVKLQRKALANGTAKVRRRQISLIELQKERLKLQRRKLMAMEKRRQEAKAKKRAAVRQLQLEAANAELMQTTQIKIEPSEQEQTAPIIDLVDQDQSSNEETTQTIMMRLQTNSPQHRKLGEASPKASPKRCAVAAIATAKPKKTTALPMHLLETIDAVARGYYSEPETRCSSILGTTTTATMATANSTTTTTTATQANAGRKLKASKTNSIEKRSKSETKKPIKAALEQQQQTFPKLLTALSLPMAKTNATTTNATATTTTMVTEATSISQLSNGVDSLETLTSTKLKHSTKKQQKSAATKSKTKISANTTIKTKTKSKSKVKPKQAKEFKCNATTIPASIEQSQPDADANNKSDADQIPAITTEGAGAAGNIVLLETNNNEIHDKSSVPNLILENSSQSTLLEISLNANASTTATLETPAKNADSTDSIDDAVTNLLSTPSVAIPANENEQIQKRNASVSTSMPANVLPHSENAQVFLQPTLPPRILCHSHHYHGKRTRSRTKFGPRKRTKQKHSTVSYELDERLPAAPRGDVIPKWNNGWTWEGEPFQGAVFLNSDDPLVIRTCYPAMRHSEGDIIRTRDCVLLKANEDNELPYVAKVAHLWENPEDGEMMVSLLWYYRPEHTEQGRQTSDSPDEVYASRHRDHNSVACIEDKCYVLTFSEYCRYRRRLRANEEDIEDVSIVPKPAASFYSTYKVPDNTNPELVMFCRRAYEFRTRRLLKMPNKQDYYVVNA